MEWIISIMHSFYDWIYQQSGTYLIVDIQNLSWYQDLSGIVGGILEVTAVTLCICCFLAGLIYSSGDALSSRRPEGIIKSFFRLIISYFLITRTGDVVFGILGIVNSLSTELGEQVAVQNESFDLAAHAAHVMSGNGAIPFISIIMNIFGFIFNVILLLIFLLLGCLILVSVYGRIFKVALYTLVAPLPFATFASYHTSRVGKGYLRAFISVCIELFAVMLVLSMMSILLRANGGVLQFFDSSSMMSDEYTMSNNSFRDAVIFLNKWALNMDIMMLVTLGLVKGTNVIVRDWMGV